ncbi:MAG: SPOR domain-containing protein [Candidatus Cloacimonas sp.]|jgi:TolA-binding protein|nr:SPOR domain-containing protein [Candidatus Cloacimonas sp.]
MPMPIPQVNRNLVLSLLFILAFTLPLGAALRKEFAEIEALFKSGKLDEAAETLNTVKASSDEDRACLAHYNARLKSKNSEAIQAHEWLIDKFPKSDYAQVSMLELGKIYILERDINKAKLSLRKITSTKLMERFYWLGLCAWWEDDFAGAISNVENYLRLEPTGEYSESAYFLMAESYLAERKAYSAITTLNKLKSLHIPNIDEQYLAYRLGYAYEQSDKYPDALSVYRNGYELNKYSHIAYLIEDRIFEMRSRNRNLDISFLYPYAPLQIAETLADSTNQSSNLIPPPIPTSSPTTPQISSPNQPVKLRGKPNSGFWLQAGRFSLEANANKLVINIRLLELPAAYYEDVSRGKKSWVVVAGSFTDKTQADAARSTLSSKDINSFVTQY